MAEVACRCLTDEQLRSFIRVFQDCQTGGCLAGKAGLAKALRQVAIVPTETEIDMMLLDVADRDRIDQIDFIIVIYYFMRGAYTSDELNRVFEVFDEDRDGKIPIETTRNVLRGSNIRSRTSTSMR
jgi:Ca2+-binding EF-hand superfamily protein